MATFNTGVDWDETKPVYLLKMTAPSGRVTYKPYLTLHGLNAATRSLKEDVGRGFLASYERHCLLGGFTQIIED